MTFPKHKPALLDERRVGAREDLYAFHGGKNWEGIDAAIERGGSNISPSEEAHKLVFRLRERLRVSTGETIHLDQKTKEQVRVDPRKTKNLMRMLQRSIDLITNENDKKILLAELAQLRIEFRERN